MRLRRKPKSFQYALLPEPDYDGDYVCEFSVQVVEVTPEGVLLRMMAEDKTGLLCAQELRLIPGQEWPFTFRRKRV